jgi:hypothetical protein
MRDVLYPLPTQPVKKFERASTIHISVTLNLSCPLIGWIKKFPLSDWLNADF